MISNATTPPLTATNESIIIELAEESSFSSSENISNFSDLDRGLLFLYKHPLNSSGEKSCAEIARSLLKKNAEHEMMMANLDASKKKWEKAKQNSLIVVITTLVLGFFSEAFTQIFDLSHESQNTARVAIITTAAAIILIAGCGSVGAEYIRGRQYHRYKEIAHLHANDQNAVQKLRIILESWGKMERARNDPESNIDRDEIILAQEKCFKSIKKLSTLEIDAHGLPDKSTFASITVTALPDNHPLKSDIEELKKLSEQRPSLSSLDGSFVDLGQENDNEAVRMHPVSATVDEDIIWKKRWETLEKNMLGIPLKYIYCHNGSCIYNPIHSGNPYTDRDSKR